jgi:hypothetical protein
VWTRADVIDSGGDEPDWGYCIALICVCCTAPHRIVSRRVVFVGLGGGVMHLYKCTVRTSVSSTCAVHRLSVAIYFARSKYQASFDDHLELLPEWGVILAWKVCMVSTLTQVRASRVMQVQAHKTLMQVRASRVMQVQGHKFFAPVTLLSDFMSLLTPG